MSPKAYTPYLNLPRRLAAALLDLLLLSLISSLVSWLIMFEYPDAEAIIDSASRLLLLFAVPGTAALWWLFQGTPGKVLLGCRIVDAHDGGRPRLWQVLVRLLGYGLSALPLGLGFFWMIWDKRHQAWHDKLARTLVVEDDESRLSTQQLVDGYR